jgi:hypothetical protein
MNLKNFADGLSIIRKYYKNPDGYHMGAEHDQIYLYATDNPMSAEDVAALRLLGWFQPEIGEDYSPEDRWSCFV